MADGQIATLTTAHAEVQPRVLLAALQHAAKHASQDFTRPHIAGALIEIRCGKLVLVSTDGHRLLKATINAATDLAPDAVVTLLAAHSSIIQLVSALKCHAKADPSMLAVVDATSSLLTLTTMGHGQTTCVQAVQEQFPPYAKVIPAHAITGRADGDNDAGPSGCGMPHGVEASYLADAAMACAAIAPGSKHKPVRIVVGGALNPLSFYAENEDATCLVVVMTVRI